MSLVEDIDEDDYHVGTPDDSDHFLSPSFSHGRTGDQTWNIKDLDLRTPVFECTRDDRERGEFVRGDLTLGPGERGLKGCSYR